LFPRKTGPNDVDNWFIMWLIKHFAGLVGTV
jgi:hypothetical protein